MIDDWLDSPACDLGRGIESGKVDPVDLAEGFLSSIERHPEAESIYALISRDRCRAEAEAARARAREGRRRSLLDGVPISWKDVFDTANLRTEAGSLLLRDRIPKRDAEVVRRATEAGLVCLGKTRLSELAYSGLGVNPKTGTPPSASNEGSVPGGSSSGAAASVAFDLAAAGIGSDTGGSVRIPAAWNNLVGLKTSSGSLPLEGVVPLCPKFDTIGPIARTVEDVGAIYSALACRQTVDLAGCGVKQLRFLILEDVVADATEQQCAAGFENSVSRIAAAGARLDCKIIPAVAESWSLAACLFGVEAYAQWSDEVESGRDLMFKPILERFLAGREFSAEEYARSWKRLRELRQIYLEATADYDAVLIPTAPILPPKIKDVISDPELHARQNLLALRNTRIANLMGISSITLPTGVNSTGIMLLGQRFEEARLLRTGKAVEAELH